MRTRSLWSSFGAVAAIVLVAAGCGSSSKSDAAIRDGGGTEASSSGDAREGGAATDAPGGTEAGGGDATRDVAVDAPADAVTGSDATAGDRTSDSAGDRVASDAARDATGDGAAAMLSDAQIAAVVIEANNGELAASQVEITRGQVDAAIAFAQRMVSEHTASNQRVRMVADRLGIAPADSPVRRALANQANDAVDMLWAQPVGAVDRAYVQSQVAMHMMVLNLLDQILIPQVLNADMKAELMATRATVAGHLADAQALLAGVADAGPPDAGTGDGGAGDGSTGG